MQVSRFTQISFCLLHLSIFKSYHYFLPSPSIQQLKQPRLPCFVSKDVLIVIRTETSFLEEEKVSKLCVRDGDDLAVLRAGVGELLAGRGQDGKSGKVLMTD